MKIANRATGRFTGGAAHAAVASSALFGTLSGAVISNVVSIGVMTIPVIKKSGFKPSFAAAVKAAASTGGQVMPPAILFYLGVFMTVYFEARRQGVGPLPAEARVKLTRSELLQWTCHGLMLLL